jgi:hypothetical protein
LDTGRQIGVAVHVQAFSMGDDGYILLIDVELSLLLQPCVHD